MLEFLRIGLPSGAKRIRDRYPRTPQQMRPGFWAMHVEASNWSGLTGTVHRSALHPGQQRASLARPSRCGSSAGRLAASHPD